MEIDYRKEIQKAIILHEKYRVQCDKIKKIAIDLLSSRGIDIESNFFVFSCDFIPGEGFSFTMDFINDNEITRTITCSAFFGCFDKSYKDTDDIIQELKNRST